MRRKALNGWSALAPFSVFYGLGISLRNLLYDFKIFNSYRVRPKVISVGNLSAGGSGKSPLTIELAARLKANGNNVVVVSRGYGRRTKGVQVVADGEQVLLGPEDGGDEPVMIAQALGNVPVIVAERRIEGIDEAETRFKADVIVLDDAFQHRAVERDLDIVLIDATMPAWQWQPFPSGRLRELPGSLKRADKVVITGQNVGADDVDRMTRWIRRYSKADILRGHLEPVRFVDHESGEEVPKESASVPVAVASAIARPERFHQSVEAMGAAIVHKQVWRDHARPTAEQRSQLFARAKKAGAKAVVITAKDGVKWLSRSDDLPVWVLKTQWIWESGEQDLSDILKSPLETLSS